jgi:hypothetical protein
MTVQNTMMKALLLLVALIAIQMPLKARAEPTADEIGDALQDLMPRKPDQVIEDNLRRAYRKGYQRGVDDERTRQAREKSKPK